MFGASNDFFNGVALWNADDVSATSFFNYNSDFAMETFVGHTLLGARVHFYDYLRARSIIFKDFTDVWFAFCTSWFSQ